MISIIIIISSSSIIIIIIIIIIFDLSLAAGSQRPSLYGCS